MCSRHQPGFTGSLGRAGTARKVTATNVYLFFLPLLYQHYSYNNIRTVADYQVSNTGPSDEEVANHLLDQIYEAEEEDKALQDFEQGTMDDYHWHLNGRRQDAVCHCPAFLCSFWRLIVIFLLGILCRDDFLMRISLKTTLVTTCSVDGCERISYLNSTHVVDPKLLKNHVDFVSYMDPKYASTTML